MRYAIYMKVGTDPVFKLASTADKRHADWCLKVLRLAAENIGLTRNGKTVHQLSDSVVYYMEEEPDE